MVLKLLLLNIKKFQEIKTYHTLKNMPIKIKVNSMGFPCPGIRGLYYS
jgi:hypothetical protein